MEQLQGYVSGNKNYTAQEVYNFITMAKTMIRERNPKFRNGYSQVVYDDGIWKLTLDISGVGNYRFWVSREDRAGNFNQSLITAYRAHNIWHYSADFEIKKAVVNKYMTIIKFLDKKGIYE